ncbi:MAG: CBS domain-containing protein [Planctomycetales bacterium]|nr:CBS domain-containing protein [Planctomycetales bacterium]
MPLCPYCGAKVIEGDDECPECTHSLASLDLPEPASEVERALVNDRVDQLKPRAPLTATSDTPVAEVLKRMWEERIGCMLIVDDGVLSGIFTERDATQKLAADIESLATRPVSDFMSRDPETLEGTAKIVFAVQRMDLGGFRHVPLTDGNGAPTGVVSVRDVLRYLTAKF